MLTQWKGLTTGALAASGDSSEWGQTNPQGAGPWAKCPGAQIAVTLAHFPGKWKEDVEGEVWGPAL